MKCGRQRSKVKTLLLHRCALRKFHVTNSQNTRDQITSASNARDQIELGAFLSFLVEVQMNPGYIHVTHAY